MKNFVTVALLSLVSFTAFGQRVDLPKVKGIVRSVDIANAKIKLKHDAIPNLNMPAMTMTFNVSNPQMLNGLAQDDKVLFTADKTNGDLTVLWIEKQQTNLLAETFICVGEAPTNPITKVEFEIQPTAVKFSTIRYEFADGPFKGTAYIQSVSHMNVTQFGDLFVYWSGPEPMGTVLSVVFDGKNLTEAEMSHYSSNMKRVPVRCYFPD